MGGTVSHISDLQVTLFHMNKRGGKMVKMERNFSLCVFQKVCMDSISDTLYALALISTWSI